ncbi:la protein homolog [Lucilia sericata]|uniref:la protein homolog n=1 Tax=Lucilia sericata TaxID=13632 RepID=UPI0018A83463|nr:la protein homolog [Lucilia sericata]
MADVVEKTAEQVEEVTKETPVEEKKAEGETAVVVKEAATTEENGSDIEKKIIQQVEYYFGDANLNRDKFLLEQVGKDEEGWVPISVLLTFKRLAALSTDSNIIADAMMKSDNGLVEVSDDKLKIRRHPEKPIPEHNEERRKEIMSRTAYVKGFPLDADIDTLLKFFADFEKVSHVNMRKYLDKPSKTYKFKGSVFVTFDTKEQAEKFIEEAKPEFKNNKLICKWQEKYLEEKREEQKSKSNKKKEKKEKEEENAFVLPKRSVLYFEGANEDVTREVIREAVEKVSTDYDIAYIDFSKGEKVGHVRFTEEDTAEKFLEKLEEKKLKLKDDLSLEVRTLTEEEEKAFLAKAVENMKNRRNHFNQKKGGHHHHHGRKRRGGNNDRNDEKKAKSDD